MELVYLGFVIFLFLLAVSDLWVGVSNDAVNFLNSAIGSKAAKFRTIIMIAAIGVFCGAVMSNGMMDVARHGIFRPEQFSFSEIMLICLAVMVTDIMLLDAFNSLGMPTSTTVSMVFELLGATCAMSLLKMNSTPENTLEFSDYMNTAKALQVILGIFISVAIAFFVGVIIQWIVRLIFTFNYKNKSLKWKIGIFGGISITAIIYFMLFKGLKSMSFMTDATKDWINSNALLILGGCLIFFSILMQALHALKVNVFKIIVLVGTFALATAFAGNDLVNFIGVPLTGFASYQDWMATGGDPSTHMMNVLNESARTPLVFLLAAGVIMVVALATSKKAHNVTKTELNLAKQDEGEEMFGTSWVARSLVRFGNSVARLALAITPEGVREWIDSRFDRRHIEIESGAQYDLVRASVNLVTASLLIALGTSMKLPLSTTYVTFMVAMASSLADRAWGRESAVYRITGVLSVIGGWFLTAAIAFIATFIIAMIMHWGGMIAMVIIVIVGLVVMIHSNVSYKKKNEEENGDKMFRKILRSEDQKETDALVCQYVAQNEGLILNGIISSYKNVTDGLFTENIKQLRKTNYELKDKKGKLKNIRRKETICMRHLDQETAMRKSAWFFTSFNEIEQLYYAIRRICEPAFEHIDNHFTPIPERYVDSFIPERDSLINYMNEIKKHCEDGEFAELKSTEENLKLLQKDFSNMRKSLMEDIRDNAVNMNTGYLYLNVLQESEQMAIILKQMMRSSRKFQMS